MTTSPPPFRSTRRLIVLFDLQGYTRLVRRSEDLQIARFLDAFYDRALRALRAHDGQLVKFIGDACLAVFSPDATLSALAFVDALASDLAALTADLPTALGWGANMHLADVVEGQFGPPDQAQFDIIGQGVNHTFLMGGGEGLRLSEPVYRSLPSDARGPWRKHRPPATYTRE